MKNLFRSLALAGCFAFATTACVEENTSVTLEGVIANSSDGCTSPGSDQAYTPQLIYADAEDNSYIGWLSVKNHMSTNSAWSSSGGSSSSGSTFEPGLLNVNTIYIDQLYVKCVAIDGDEDACSGKKMLKKNVSSMPIPAGGAANISFSLSAKELDWGSFESADLSLSLHYHDSGVLSGSNYETSHVFVTLKVVPRSIYDEAYPECEKDEELTPTTSCAQMYQDDPKNFTCESKK